MNKQENTNSSIIAIRLLLTNDELISSHERCIVIVILQFN